MKWADIDSIHINTSRVQSFHWIEGRLYVRFGPDDTITFRDPERAKYLRLCGLLGVRPVEVDACGEG